MGAIKLSLAVQTPEVLQPLPVALLQGSFAEKIQKAALFGADGVELMTVNPAEITVEELSAVIRTHGLRVSSVASGGIALVTGLTLLNNDPEKAALALSRYQDLITLAARLGAPLVTLGGFRGRASQVKGDAKARLAEILYPLAVSASRHGVRLALEPLNRYESDLINNYAEGLAFIQEVNHPALGLLLDTYHVNIEESSWTEPFARAMAAGRLFHVHLGDNNRLPPGDGLIDFKSIVTTLHQGGYQGYLSAELLPRPDPDTAARRTLDHMRVLLP